MMFRYQFLMLSLGLLFLGFRPHNNTSPQQVQDTLVGNKSYYIEMKPVVRHSKGMDSEDVLLAGAFIKVFNEQGQIVAAFETSKKGKSLIRLPLNRRFSMEIGKAGFVSKRLEINTKVPPEKKYVYSFPFDIDIFQEVKKLDVSVLKKPVAKITYIAMDENFGYDMDYTNKVNTELKKMYKEYFKLQKEEEDAKKIGAAGVTGKTGK